MRKATIYGLVTTLLIAVLGVSAWAAWDPMQEQKSEIGSELNY